MTIRGVLIPAEALPTLGDGELDPLFGWHLGDMAKHVRENLSPKLEDENLVCP